ncbi:hypothetical protein DPMN_177434 [Dreissena polymorpha]|uniref:Uncharacterized protein n=1 Tax=Dreissena polymorpha TaxID=45954 RepID=A0A9D4EB12_DREPO|nr:hypothetical protein DPMN_177434 [Dreissena polymorpha]
MTTTVRVAATDSAQAYEKKSSTAVPRALWKEVRQEERDRTGKDNNAHEAMAKEITLDEMENAIKQLNTTEYPGPDKLPT